MGGSTFTTPAIRMSSDTLDCLTTYCTARLSSMFPQIERMHHVRSKADHGDLDLICAVPGEVPIKRQHVGPLGRHQYIADWKVGEDGKEGDEPHGAVEVIWEGKGSDEVKRFALEIAQKLGAVEWIVAFYGYPLLALKLPCRLITHTTGTAAGAAQLPDEAFYQVDLGLIPPPSFPFYRILTSYSIPYAAIVLALQSLSPAIWLRRDALTLRHSPLAGYPLIDVTLSRDLNAVMSLLGLDMDRWEKGFDTKEELYKWLVNTREGSLLEAGWKVVKEEGLGRMRVDWKRFHTRVDGLPGFIEWMRSNEGNKHDEDAIKTSSDPINIQSPSTDPEHPTPLDPLAASLLDNFGKQAEYDAQLASRQSDARRVLARQKQREVNRQRGEDMKKAKEARLELERQAEAGVSVRAQALEFEAGLWQMSVHAGAKREGGADDTVIPIAVDTDTASRLAVATDDARCDEQAKVEAMTLALAMAQLDGRSPVDSSDDNAREEEAGDGGGDETLVEIVPPAKDKTDQ